MKLFDYLIERLKEASTWRGIIAVVTAGGLTLNPEQQTAIITAGLALMGLTGIFTKDKDAK